MNWKAVYYQPPAPSSGEENIIRRSDTFEADSLMKAQAEADNWIKELLGLEDLHLGWYTHYSDNIWAPKSSARYVEKGRSWMALHQVT